MVMNQGLNPDATGYERGVSWFTAQEIMGNITVDI